MANCGDCDKIRKLFFAKLSGLGVVRITRKDFYGGKVVVVEG